MKLTVKRLNEFAKMFTHIQKREIELSARNYKTERGLLNYLTRTNREAEIAHNKPLPIYIEIEVDWCRSRTWGWCPRASMRWEDANGGWHYIENASYASGWGYDKHSTVVAECLNRFKNLRYAVRNKNFKKSPYGISKSDYSYCYFEGGVGMSCYPPIMSWLGYEMKRTANGKTYDKWVIIKKSERRRFL
jgi:hypothetical protein